MPQTAVQLSPKIFVNYRSVDTAGYGRQLKDLLKRRFGHGQVFFAKDDIEFGQHFERVIDEALDSCRVLLAVIGRNWFSRSDAGNNRKDYVRYEIAAALARKNVLVIPVLVQGAELPREEDLPEDLKRITALHACPLSEEHWDEDVERLIEKLKRELAKAPLLTKTRVALLALMLLAAVGLSAWRWWLPQHVEPKALLPTSPTPAPADGSATPTPSQAAGVRGSALVSATPTPAREALPQPPQDASVSDYVPKAFKVKPGEVVRNDVGMDLVLIPAGSFLMGSTNDTKDEMSPHQVTFARPFYMGKYEVTQAEWKRVMSGDNPSVHKADRSPVENVSWTDAQAFIKKLNEVDGKYIYHLPSEAEWEYACRAGTTTEFSFGDTLTQRQANFGTTAPTSVGSFSPNAFGLFDMHGNVWEWCEDLWHRNYDYGDAPSDGSAWVTNARSPYRVLRGGSWRIGVEEVRLLRSANRFPRSPEEHNALYGIRVAAVERP